MWFQVKCPVATDEQRWIDDNMSWFVDQCGTSPLDSPVVLPNDEFFPGAYTGTEPEVRRAAVTVAGYMGIESNDVGVELDADPVDKPGGDSRWTTTTGRASPIPSTPSLTSTYSGRAGSYRSVAGRGTMFLSSSLSARPLLLVATVAREIARDRLFGEDGIACARAEEEALADLLTVYLGLGVFTANAALEFTHTTDEQFSRSSRWSASRLGLLTEPMYGYALARYALMRGERNPPWARFLDTNPRTYMKRGLRFLKKASHSSDSAPPE